MRTTPLHLQHHLPLPRGWIVLGGALVSWALVAGLWTVAGRLSGFVLSAI